MIKKRYSTEKKVYAQLRFFEELHIIKDAQGEILFTGNAVAAQKILKLLNQDRKSGKSRKRAKRK